MERHPLHEHSFGVVRTITSMIDLWLAERRLPNYMRLAPEVGE